MQGEAWLARRPKKGRPVACTNAQKSALRKSHPQGGSRYNLRVMRGALVRRPSPVLAAAVWLSVLGWHALDAAGPQATRAAAPVVTPDVRATVDKYCVTCHNQRLKTGNLALDGAEL